MPQFQATRKSIGESFAWLTVLAICLQPLLIDGSGCECNDESRRSTHQVTSWIVESDAGNCCNSKKLCASASTTRQATSVCCCDPNSNVCHCADCDCGVKDEIPALPLTIPPPIPANDVQIQISLLSFPFEAVPLPTDSRQLSIDRANETIPLSAQQTCVLFSRFTC